MKKAYRVKKNEEIQYILNHGESFANRQLVLYYLKKDGQDHFRIGLSVGKKLGNAVTRNQIKRYLREAFKHLEDKIDPSYDFVVIARKPTNEMDFHGIKKSLSHLMKRTNMFRQ
ncbi:ribonuclease P protein component [Halalkalibacillus sediminis]|uniref:Ribonuclease P protein component n=1 Tax=Halalkalibacillus sediminis TaxID=2018042 RepID=A0A2I0QSX3_9BACI|nr:ribonuclease P protein component [Halalkalibacillus sediminis]PKR77437.1 ribonuclease P protein component [Halalkalibacillus sediminis]